MVSQRFPGANLIGQLLRQVTQPLSKAIVKHVKKQPFLRKYVLIQLGRFYYWCEDRIKLRKIPPGRRAVDDVRTMEAGTKLLLEVRINASPTRLLRFRGLENINGDFRTRESPKRSDGSNRRRGRY